ncbi:MAG: hypothetical protein JETCAE03_37070 [Ignavibacteriaceae bacterium]|nr:MAG: hypothetical protein JETCAE03_37070 [Ignavibacteriaceae bacterium]
MYFLIQAYLSELFITGHDAMHRTVSKYKMINDWIGRTATFLFAGMSYNRLIKNHFMHHKHPGEENDPDFNTKSQNLFI